MSSIYSPLYSGSSWQSKVDKVIDSVNKSWSRDQIVLFLCVKLAPFFQRDLSFFLLSYEDRCIIHDNGFKPTIDGRVVCKTLCEYYLEILKHFGIKSKVIVASTDRLPHYCLLVKGDTCVYFVDLINGLMSYQYKKINRGYGVVPNVEKCCVFDNYKYVKNLDLSYVKKLTNSLYLDDSISSERKILYFKNLVKENGGFEKIFNCNNTFDIMKKKIEYIGNHFINLGDVRGAIERKMMYMYLINTMFDDNEKGDNFKNIKTYLWKNNNDDLTDVDIIISISFFGKRIEYVEDMKEDRYVLVKK